MPLAYTRKTKQKFLKTNAMDFIVHLDHLVTDYPKALQTSIYLYSRFTVENRCFNYIDGLDINFFDN